MTAAEAWIGGQRRLRGAELIIAGAGSVGTIAAAYLAAAGVGRIGIVDGGIVAPEQLSRQALLYAPDAGLNRAEVTARKLMILNPSIQAQAYPVPVEPGNIIAIAAEAACVISVTGDPGAAGWINSGCMTLGIPLLEGVTGRWGAAAAQLRPGGGPCRECADWIPEPPQHDSHPGPVAGLVGSWLALKALQLLAGDLPDQYMVATFGARDGELKTRKISRNPACSTCSAAASSANL